MMGKEVIEFEVERAALVAALTRVARLVRVRHPGSDPAILRAVRIRANGAVELTATDLDVTRTVSVPITAGKGAGDYLIDDARRTLKALKLVGGDRMTCRAEVVAHVGAAEIVLRGGDSEISVPQNLPVEDFPAAPLVLPQVEMTVGAAFADAIARVAPAVSTEHPRFYLNGVAIRHLGDWAFRLCTTDGHRLFVQQIEIPDWAGAMWDGDLIIPQHALAMIVEVARADGGARLAFGRPAAANADKDLAPETPAKAGTPTRLSIASGDDVLTVVLIDGHFPDVTRAFPAIDKDSPRVRLSLLDLRRAAKMVAALSPRKYAVTELAVFDNVVRVRSKNMPEDCCAQVSIAAEAWGASGAVIGVNGHYLRDALDALGGDTVDLTWAVKSESERSNPLRIERPDDDRFFIVQMPMRI